MPKNESNPIFIFLRYRLNYNSDSISPRWSVSGTWVILPLWCKKSTRPPASSSIWSLFRHFAGNSGAPVPHWVAAESLVFGTRPKPSASHQLRLPLQHGIPWGRRKAGKWNRESLLLSCYCRGGDISHVNVCSHVIMSRKTCYYIKSGRQWTSAVYIKA